MLPTSLFTVEPENQYRSAFLVHEHQKVLLACGMVAAQCWTGARNEQMNSRDISTTNVETKAVCAYIQLETENAKIPRNVQSGF